MDWKQLLVYISSSVEEEFLLRIAYPGRKPYLTRPGSCMANVRLIQIGSKRGTISP